ncbi:U-box domain-containing protein 44-like [Magnolia sinica]|uniref:U-box domain-containing protein 44-like n=1 Tax=Magnolia sinica TaxID=86752 RepID=UPI002657DFDF|nr:U-box domain-containing protein 44-like [Magnolia sinica]XP_058092849.1 U-box domain-containing protein 44-like [Magnolia sinica]
MALIDEKNVLEAALQNLCDLFVAKVMNADSNARDVMIDKESSRQFSKYVTDINILLKSLHAQRVEDRIGQGPAKATLQKLDSQVREACEIIKRCESGSSLSLLLNPGDVLAQMRRTANEIAETVSLLGVSNLNTTLEVKSKTDRILNDLQSLEFRSAATAEAIISEIEKTMTKSGSSQALNIQLLQKIAEAVGARQNASPKQREPDLLKEDMKPQKQGEELQLSQLMQFLHSSEVEPCLPDERFTAYQQHPMRSSPRNDPTTSYGQDPTSHKEQYERNATNNKGPLPPDKQHPIHQCARDEGTATNRQDPVHLGTQVEPTATIKQEPVHQGTRDELTATNRQDPVVRPGAQDEPTTTNRQDRVRQGAQDEQSTTNRQDAVRTQDELTAANGQDPNHPDRQDSRTSTNRHDPIRPLMCQLCEEVMEDPVAIVCGHSFERRAIQEHFERGGRSCPTCEQELPSRVLTPNISLRRSIEEWKLKNLDSKLQTAVSALTSNDTQATNQGLEELQFLMAMARCRSEVTERGLVPKIVESIKASGSGNSKAALKCLCYLANHSDDNKEAIVGAGAIRCIVKQIGRGEVEPDAVRLLQALSEKEELIQEIGNAKDSIAFLVTLLQNPKPDISSRSRLVLENLSSNAHFIIKMAEAGHFQPFIDHFNQGSLETQTSMATALTKMQLNANSVKALEHKQFISTLIQVLSSSSPAHKTACLECIKKLSNHPEMANQFLAEPATIPALLNLISNPSSNSHWQNMAAGILTPMVESSQLSDFHSNPNMEELQSQHNISVFLHLAASSTPQIQAQFLHLLLAICNISEMACDQLRSDDNAVAQLYSSLNGNHVDISQQALKLLHCMAEHHPAGIPLPPPPTRESAVNTLVTIFISSPEVHNKSIAAGIIGLLPADDDAIDNILCKSETLKTIHEVICAADEGIEAFFTTPDRLLLENALAALVRFTKPNKPEIRKQLGELELYPLLVRMLSTGSSVAKKRTAIALAHLSQSTIPSTADAAAMSMTPADSEPMPWLRKLLPSMSWCCSSSMEWQWSPCSIHGSACSSRHTFCLVRVDAVRPLVQMLREMEAAEAAILALETLLKDDTTISSAAAVIVDNQGVEAIHDLLERGPISAKDKALDLFEKISKHVKITGQQFRRSERILMQLLLDDTLKKKAALVLSHNEVISKQSSFF